MNIEAQEKELFISLQEYVDKFIPGTQEIVMWFHQGEEQKALSGMIDVVEGLSWICEAISLTQEFHCKHIDTERINPLLVQLNEGLVESDTVLIADVLEYEIIPVVEEWNKAING